jgi:phenylpropionate dioxygenase-like ring-hydroxylating dioxygenase large terminal subunit
MFIRNAWYIAAWGDEVGDRPLARRILDRPVVLFRDQRGAAAALEDRCCHRGTPLALGQIVPQGIQCGYHGLVFDPTGKCVLVPGNHNIPRGAFVRNYPLVEKDDLIWIWMGDPQYAEPASVLSYPYHNDQANWPYKHAVYHIRGGYMLVIDNLMDLSHLGYVHGGTVGGAPATHIEASMRTLGTATGVRFDRWMIDSTPPPTYVRAVGFKGRVDRWQETEFFAPSTVLQWIGAVDVGTGVLRDWKYDGVREGGFSFRLLHGLTPETGTSCHYFWSAANGYRQNQPEATELLFEEVGKTFEQDKHVIEAQQTRLLETSEEGLVDIHGDGARLHARRAVDRMLAEESR